MSKEVKEVATSTAPTPKTPAEKQQERQGKRTFEKKKVNKFTQAEAKKELQRLQNGGQGQSVYCQQVLRRAQQED